MRLAKCAIALMVLATFLLTLSQRQFVVRAARPPGMYVTVVVYPSDRWFVLPAPLRPEDGIVESAIAHAPDVSRPAFAIATVLGVFAIFQITSEGWLTHRFHVTAQESGTILIPFAMCFAVVSTFPLMQALRGDGRDRQGDDGP